VSGVPVQTSPWQLSDVVQELPSSHGVPFAAVLSGGQSLWMPSHVSATSQAPADARQVTLAFPAGC